MSLHPFSLGPGDWESYSNLANAAASRGYLAITPLGSDPGPRWAVPGGLETGADDMSYIDLLLDKVVAGWCVDHSRIFAAGFSAGAAMAVGLSCVLSDRFRGIAASGGSNLTTLCPGSDGVGAMILHGTADPIAPVTGSETPTAPPLGLHLEDVLDSFADRNGCTGTPTAQSVTNSVTRWTYQGCAAATPLVHMELRGAGHTWAGAPAFPLIDLIVGSTDMSVSANTLVLDFFDAL